MLCTDQAWELLVKTQISVAGKTDCSHRNFLSVRKRSQRYKNKQTGSTEWNIAKTDPCSHSMSLADKYPCKNGEDSETGLLWLFCPKVEKKAHRILGKA